MARGSSRKSEREATGRWAPGLSVSLLGFSAAGATLDCTGTDAGTTTGAGIGGDMVAGAGTTTGPGTVMDIGVGMGTGVFNGAGTVMDIDVATGTGMTTGADVTMGADTLTC